MSSVPAAETTRKEAGFSLFEAMVALAVFSLSAVSALTLITQNVRSAIDLEARAFATMVAENVLVESRLQKILTTSDTVGKAQMGGFDFEWERRVYETGEEGLKRITVDVKQDGQKQTLIVLNGFRNE